MLQRNDYAKGSGFGTFLCVISMFSSHLPGFALGALASSAQRLVIGELVTQNWP